MFDLYYGTDTHAIRTNALQAISSVSCTRIDSDTYRVGMVSDVLGAVSLFGDTPVCLIDTPSSVPSFKEEVLAALPTLAESSNQFVIIEGALLAVDRKPYITYATKSQEFKISAAERFNTFAMADALAKKDKKQLWLLLQVATQNGLAEEEIIGVLWWQLKALRVAAVTTSAAEAGMKDYPYQKAKRALVTFAPGELERLSHELLTVYHDGHGGRKDIGLALESWTLTL